MRRGGRVCRIITMLILAAIGWTAGCSGGTPSVRTGPEMADLLLSREYSSQLATQIGRSDWPAAFGAIEGPEDTVYLEYYRDYQGSRAQERSNPRRMFRSYRVGNLQR